MLYSDSHSHFTHPNKPQMWKLKSPNTKFYNCTSMREKFKKRHKSLQKKYHYHSTNVTSVTRRMGEGGGTKTESGAWKVRHGGEGG